MDFIQINQYPLDKMGLLGKVDIVDMVIWNYFIFTRQAQRTEVANIKINDILSSLPILTNVNKKQLLSSIEILNDYGFIKIYGQDTETINFNMGDRYNDYFFSS